MKLLLLLGLLLMYGCADSPSPEEGEKSTETAKKHTVRKLSPSSDTSKKPYEWSIGIGYGFIEKGIEIKVDGKSVIKIRGNKELERHAQLKGPKIVKSFFTDGTATDLEVIIDGKTEYKGNLDKKIGHIIIIKRHEGQFELRQVERMMYR